MAHPPFDRGPGFAFAAALCRAAIPRVGTCRRDKELSGHGAYLGAHSIGPGAGRPAFPGVASLIECVRLRHFGGRVLCES